MYIPSIYELNYALQHEENGQPSHGKQHAKEKGPEKKANGHLQKTNAIHQFPCPEEGCKLLKDDKYVGATATTLSKILTMHKQQGAVTVKNI